MAAGQSAGPSTSTSTSAPSRQRLEQAAATFKHFAGQDKQSVDLAEYLNASVNHAYKLHLSLPWAPLKKIRHLTIPDAVIQASTSARSYAAQGLFPEVERAWIIIDSQLYLWNYLEGTSSAFESYVHPTDVIQSVSLVLPKPGVFIDSIKHLLIISTEQSVTLLGLALENTPTPNSQSQLLLYQTDFTLQTSGVILRQFCSTKDGSRIFCRGSDGCLYELVYQAKEGWFSAKCSLKNLTSSGITNLLPEWAGGVSKEPLDALAIDHSRSLLYVLSSRRSISVYSVPVGQNTQPPQLITTLRDIHRTASLISPNNATLLRQEEFAIVSLQPIQSEESRTVSLLATTNHGVRLYFTNQRSGYRAFTTPSSSLGGAATLELLYVRSPPAAGLAPSPVPSSTLGRPEQGDYPQTQPALQHLSDAIYKEGIFLAAGPYPHEGGLDNILCINRATNTSAIVNNTTVPAGAAGATSTSSILPSASSATTPADPAEQATNVLVQGATWALAEVPRPTASSLNPLVRQMTSLPRTFLVLTSTGLTVLVENRPVDLLRDLLERSNAASGPGIAETVGLVEVFKRHGQAQACAMALAIATRNSHISVSLEGLLSSSPPTAAAFSSQMLSAESLMNAARIYFDYGGMPRYEAPPYPHQPVSEGRVVLSGRHDGLGVYIARLLGMLWDKSLKTIGSGIGSPSPSSVIGKDLEELRSFIRSHFDAFGLNAGRGGQSASSEVEMLANRAEEESLRSSAALLERVIEALSFLVLIADLGWDKVMTKAGAEIQKKAETMTFGDLILEVPTPETTGASSSETASSAPTTSRSLVEALIDLHSTSSPVGMDVIADLLQSRCSSFCDANDVRLYKALERIRQAKELPVGPRRDEALRESEALMMKASSRLPFERLQEVVRLWKEMKWVAGAVQLPLKCAAEWDPHGFALAWRLDGMPETDATRKAAYDRSMRCYGLVLETLQTLDEEVEATRRGGTDSSRVESFRASAYSLTQQSPDPLLHEALYDFLLASGRREQLLELRTPFLEDYLKQEPLTLEKLEMLWQCYTRRGEGAAAARVLVGLAESTELDLNLFQRLEYLTLASNNAKSSTNGSTSDVGYATVAFIAEIEEKLEVAQVQVEVYRAVSDLQDIEEDAKKAVLQELDSALLDISTLYRSFSDPLSLDEVKILIYHVADFRDTELVAVTWDAILQKAHDDGERMLSADRAYERMAAVVIQLGQRFATSEVAFPIDVLARHLEVYSFRQRTTQSIPKGWAPQTLLSATCPAEAIFDVLDSLYQSKMEPWHTKSSLVFLMSDIHHLVQAWLGLYLRGGSGGFGGSRLSIRSRSSVATINFPAKRVDDALNAYLVSLNSLVGQLREEKDVRMAQDCLNGMKVLQDRLRGVF